MDVSLAAISAGAGAIIIGGCAYLVWLSLPRDEDYFERDLAELLELTTAPGYSHHAPLAGEHGNTVSHHRPGSGSRGIVECETSPPIISGSDRWPPDGPESDGRVIQPPLPGAPVSSIVSSPECFGGFALGQLGSAADAKSCGRASFIHPVEGSGDAVPVSHHRDRPVMFLVSSK